MASQNDVAVASDRVSVHRAVPRVSPVRFFALTFVLSWVVWVPLMLVRIGVISSGIPQESIPAIALLGVLMPAVSAMTLTAAGGERHAVRSLLGGLGRWRLGWWWAAVLALQPALLVIAALIHNGLGRGAPLSLVAGLTVGTFIVNIVFLIIASLGEEIGWRGVALPSLQLQHSAFVSSVILGLVTATWHLPYWVLLGTLDQYGTGYFVTNYLFIVAITFHLTWLYNHGRSSLLLAVAFHVVFNAVNVALLPVTSSTVAFALLTGLEWAVALVLIRYLGPREAIRLSRSSSEDGVLCSFR